MEFGQYALRCRLRATVALIAAARDAMRTGGALLVIDFSKAGNSAHFRREGWSGQEDDRVWAVGPRAVLRAPIQSSGRSLILEAEIGPCRVPPEVGGQL